MFDPFTNLPSEWFYQDSPFVYWFVTYIFGPAFVMGSWGLVAVFLAHLVPLVLILRWKWQSFKAKPLWKRLFSFLGLFLLIHLLVGLLFWLLLPLLMMVFYVP